MKKLLLLVYLLVLPSVVVAQSVDDPLEPAKNAFREGRYQEALRTLEQVTAQYPDLAEAHYLMARLYTETPLADARKAERAIDQALAIEPENVQYLVANLQQLRTDSWNFIAERLKEIKRLELARKILALDPENAFAHEELGITYIHDFWRYRNAIMMPMLRYGQGRFDPDELTGLTVEGMGTLQSDAYGFNYDPIDPREVFIADQFDVEALQRVGVAAQDLSGRAERAYQAAIGHLKQALVSDVRRRSVYDHLMRIFALKGEYADALPMLEEMNVFFTDDPQQWLYLGLAQYHLGDLEGAEESFERGLALLPEEDREPFEQLDLILPEPEKARYLADRSGYAAKFWNSKDPRYLTRYNERKLEHYARLVYADLLYAAPDLDRRGWETERGRILVRYGLPRYDVTIVPEGNRPKNGEVLIGVLRNESTIRPDQGGADPRGQSAASSTPNVHSRLNSDYQLFDEMNTFNIWDYGEFRFVFEDPFRNGEYRLYSPPATQLAAGMDGWINDYEIIARETFRKTPERYVYESPARQIELPFLVNTFKSPTGGSDVYVHFGIPIEEYDRDQDMIRVTANTGAFLISGEREIVQEKRRTVYGLSTQQIVPFSETNLWVESEHLEADAGTHEVSVEFETASGSTVAVQRRTIDVPDYNRGELALSDMMLAYLIHEAADGVGPADIERDGLAITPAPWSVFRKDGPIYLYFETYGLKTNAEGNTDYDIEIALTPKEESKGLKRVFGGLFGGDRGVSISFSGSGSSPDEAQYQILDATEVDTGLYTLSLRVRDNVARKSVETQKDLFVE